jgi:hypothetical protein
MDVQSCLTPLGLLTGRHFPDKLADLLRCMVWNSRDEIYIQLSIPFYASGLG